MRLDKKPSKNPRDLPELALRLGPLQEVPWVCFHGFFLVWLGQPGMVGLGVWVFGFFLETFRDFGVLGEIWNLEALFP